MANTIKLMFSTIKVFVLFTGCTILFYYGMVWINQEYEYYHRYDAPGNGAVKVTADNQQESLTWWERIRMFYIDGE
jgi:hypothetical protein